MKIFHYPYGILLFAGLCCTTASMAHNINYALQDAPPQGVAAFYLQLGLQHILPYGLDHILFITALCLLNTKFKTILWQATAFTIAHTITLAMSMKNIVALPTTVVEPIIALSILFVGLENLFISELKPWRILLVFTFGLVHGMGFASALKEIGLPPGQFVLSVLSFNAGVELGQIVIIALIFSCVILPFQQRPWFRKMAVYPLSIFIILTSAYWTITRLFQ